MSDDMLEVEMKFPVADLARLGVLLQQRGAQPGAVIEEADAYYNAPDRDFARTDEALRVRRQGPHTYITYKGPKLDTQTKTRVELETALADGEERGEQLGQILQHLGYRPVAVVKKRRKKYWLHADGFEIEASLDDVDQVGTYAELEIKADRDHLDRARNLVRQLAADLGLKDSERRSYLELLLKAREQQIR
jgi:adenylate cyclase class 2